MTVTWEIRPQKTCLIVHDMVNEMVDEKGLFFDPAIRDVVRNIQRILEACRRRNVYVAYAVPGWETAADLGRIADFYPEIPARGAMLAGAWATQVHPSLAPRKGELMVRKRRIGAFHGTRLHQLLKARGIDTVVVTGTSTGVGCDMTARDAMNRDYKAIVVSDSCLSRPMGDQGWGPVSKAEVEKVHFSSLARAFAMVVSTQKLLTLLDTP